LNHLFILGQKIYLRPIQAEDIELLLEGENDPGVRETLFLAQPLDSDMARERLTRFSQAKDSLVLTIVDRNTEQAIGQTAFFRIDWVSRAAIFYLAVLKPEFWAKGIGSEATSLMVDYAFETLNLNRIQLHVFAGNQAAIKIYQKVGFIQEGVLRQAMFHHGKYCDFWVMGILRSDFIKSKR
jgi:RimJ/RimL family protein N-acetyltransferase